MKLESVISSEEILQIGETLRERKKDGYDWRMDIVHMHMGRINSYSLEQILGSVRCVRNNLTSDPEVFAGLVE